MATVTDGAVRTLFNDMARGLHRLDSDTLMIALYQTRDAVTIDTVEYTPEGETIGVNYIPGGIEMFIAPGYPVMSADYALEVRLQTVRFINLTGTVGSALIYNGDNNRAIRAIDFGIAQDMSSTDFVIEFPAEAVPPVFIKYQER